MYAKILSTGAYLPQKVLTNQALAETVDTSDEWIQKRVGIKQRHQANDDESTTFMAEQAAKQALAQADLDKVDLIITATGTPDYLMPSTSVLLQHALNMPQTTIAFDISAACAGFVQAIDIAKQYLENGSIQNALVIGAESMTQTLDWQDRATCVLFGDGAGAVVLSGSQTPGILASLIRCDGSGMPILNLPNSLPNKKPNANSPFGHLSMQGNKVFRMAVASMTKLVEDLLKKADLTNQDINWLVPHQANYRILEAIAKKLKMPMEKVITTLQHHGNTSAASVPLALDHALTTGMIVQGDIFLSEAFGAGLIWGGFIAKV